jgi:hypothetical protein
MEAGAIARCSLVRPPQHSACGRSGDRRLSANISGQGIGLEVETQCDNAGVSGYVYENNASRRLDFTMFAEPLRRSVELKWPQPVLTPVRPPDSNRDGLE